MPFPKVPSALLKACPPIQFASAWEQLASTTDDTGVAHAHFKKVIAVVGKYHQEADDVTYDFTHELFGHWVAVFGEMTANGVKVPLVMAPEHQEDELDRNRGWLQKLYIEGNDLVGEFEVIGEDAITSVVRNDVSVFSPPVWKDGTGKEYKWPLVNIALTGHPLIPGLGDWTKIAASRVQGGKEKGMWKKIAKALGIDASKWTDEDAEKQLFAAIKVMQKAQKDAIKEAKKSSIKASLESEDEDIKKEVEEVLNEAVKDQLEEAVETRTAEIRASLDKDPEPISATLIELSSENRATKIDALEEAGRITPDVAKKFKTIFSDEKAVKAALQRGTNSDHFKELVEALVDNDPIVLVEKTGAQVIKAALPKPKDGVTKDEDNAVLKDADRRAEAAKK